MVILHYFLLPVLGLSVGVISSFFGIGGGVIMMPFLLLLFPDQPYLQILATSMGVIFLITSFNTYNYHKQDFDFEFKKYQLLIFGVIVGVLIGAQFVESIDPNLGKKIFSFFLLLSILKTAFLKPHQEEEVSKRVSSPINFLTGFVAGIVSALTGLGGGIILIPIFISVFKMPLKKVAPTSNLVMVFITLVALIRFSLSGNMASSDLIHENSNFLLFGTIHIDHILLISVGAFMSSLFGVKLNNKMSNQKKKWSLVTLLVIMLILLVWKTSH